MPLFPLKVLKASANLILRRSLGLRKHIAHGVLVTAVRFSRPMHDAFRFVKISRVKPYGAAVLSIAAVVSKTDDRVSEARVALGAMAETPVRAHSLEGVLKGAALTPPEIKRAVT